MAKKIKNSYSPFFNNRKENEFDCIEQDINGSRCEEQCSFCSLLPMDEQ